MIMAKADHDADSDDDISMFFVVTINDLHIFREKEGETPKKIYFGDVEV